MRRRLALPLAISALGCLALAASPAAQARSAWGREYRIDSRITPIPRLSQIEVNKAGAALTAWTGNGGDDPEYYPVKVRDASGRFSATTINSFENVTNAFLDERGNAFVLRYGYQTDDVRYTTRAPGGAWTPERVYDGDVPTAMSQSGYLGAVSTYPSNTAMVTVTDPAGRVTTPVTLKLARTVIGSDGLVVNDDGSAVAGFDSEQTSASGQTCKVTQVGGRNADGSVRAPVVVARRCAPRGVGIDDAQLTASSSGLGAVVSWTNPSLTSPASRFGVAVRTARGTWVEHVMPRFGGRTVASTVSAADGYVWVWWAVQGPTALSIYTSHFNAGRWAPAKPLRRYAGANVRVVQLTSAAGTAQRAVAWTVQPRKGSLYVSRLRTVVNGTFYEEGLGGRTTIGDLSARGRHAGLIEYKQNPGPLRQDVVVRFR